jgi:anti-sigma factor RsiW
VSCSRARRELLEQFALGEELGSRSVPHLAHLESCADCRREVGIDRQLVKSLRRALGERVEGYAPSEASWGAVRRRTVDRPVRPWTGRVVYWGGMVSAAAAAGIMIFAVATAPEMQLFPRTDSSFVASAARRAAPPVEEARSGWPLAQQRPYLVPQTDTLLPGQRLQMKMAGEAATREGEPPIPGLR